MKKLILTYSLLLTTFSLLLGQPTSFAAHGIGGGGAQYNPSINPSNSQEIYSTTDMTDLYHSTNGGASWNVISFKQVRGGTQTWVQFTNNNNIRYCLGGDLAIGGDVPLKSTDGGTTWNPITDPSGGNGDWTLYANPQSSTQLIVGDYTDLYFSNNGGTTFSSSFYNDASGNGAYVAGVFFDGANIYVCTNKGIVSSTNNGVSWSAPATDGITTEDIVSFAGVKSGTTVRFYCVTQSSGSVYVGTNGQNASSYANVYTMTYPGTWTKCVNGIASGDMPFYVVTANNINEAFLGGSSSAGNPMVLKTTNAGASWSYVFNTTTNQNIKTGYCGSGGDLGWGWPGAVFGLNMSVNDSLTVVETDEGFIHKTTDGGKTWQALYVPPAELNPANSNTPKGKYYQTNGIEMTSGWDLMWFDSLHVFAGYTDIVATRSNDGGNSWGFDCKGLTLNTTYKFLKNPATGVIYAATSSIHDMYQSTRLTDNIIDAGTGAIMYSTDTGKTFNTMYNFGKPVIWLALDPTSPTGMYASVINHAGSGSAGGIWVSNNINLNASATWTHCPNPARTQGHPLDIVVLKDGTVVTTFSGRRNSTNFTDSSGVFMSINQGTSWTDVSAPGMKYWTMDLTVDPNDATQNTWYVCVYGGWGGAANNQGGLYRTTNRGTSWTRVVNASNVNAGDTANCFSLSFDPVNKGAAYLTTENGGLFYTANVSATKPVFNQVAAYPFEQPTRVYFNPYIKTDVWVNSFGNGIEKGSISPTLVNEISASKAMVNIYPNPNHGTFTVEVANTNEKLKIEVYNILGEKVYVSDINNPKNQLVMPEYLNGLYIVKVLTNDGVLISTGKVVIEN